MFEQNKFNSSESGPFGFSGETDRVNGEYHYRNGYTQKIYSDAHYTSEEDTTSPPRYYVPPQQPVRETVEKNERKRTQRERRPFPVVAAILACSVFSGVLGAYLSDHFNSAKYAEIEQRLNQIETENTAVFVTPSPQLVQSSRMNNSAPAELSRSEIYDLACNQVVGVTTEVTYSNFFGRTSSSAVTGTGFIVSDDGYVITNYHVIDYAYKYGYKVSVIMHDGTEHDAVITGVDADNDIAVLNINANSLVPVEFGNSDEISVGDSAYAVGNPLGELDFTMTSGTVSAMNRLIAPQDAAVPINMFQIDAAVNSGNSGGPVYDSMGRVIGVVTAKYSSNGVEGIGFAIPINDAVRIAGELIENGYVTGKPYLGVCYDQSNTSIYNRYYRDLWNAPKGVLVLDVERGSCASKAGLKPYDIITALDEFPIEDSADLLAALNNFSAGDTVEITVFRASDDLHESKLTYSISLDEMVPKAYPNNMSVA